MSRFKLKAWQRRRLRRQLDSTSDARTYSRTLAVLELDRGRSAADIADMLGVTRQSIHNWVAAYVRESDPSALTDDYRQGRPRLLTEDTEDLLRLLLTCSPQDLGYPATDWTVRLLQQELESEMSQRPSDDTIRRGLHQLGYVWKRPRYVLAPDEEREKKTADSAANPGSAASERRLGAGRDRPPAVPTLEVQMGAARRNSEGLVDRAQRPARDLRRDESVDGDAGVVAAAQGVERGLPGVPRRSSLALPGLARGIAHGFGPESHGPCIGEGVGRDHPALAAEAVARVESDGHIVGSGQGRNQYQQAIPHH
jgi:transposase